LMDSDEPIPRWLRHAIAARLDPQLDETRFLEWTNHAIAKGCDLEPDAPAFENATSGRIVFLRDGNEARSIQAHADKIEIALAVLDAEEAGYTRTKALKEVAASRSYVEHAISTVNNLPPIFKERIRAKLRKRFPQFYSSGTARK